MLACHLASEASPDESYPFFTCGKQFMYPISLIGDSGRGSPLTSVELFGLTFLFPFPFCWLTLSETVSLTIIVNTNRTTRTELLIRALTANVH